MTNKIDKIQMPDGQVLKLNGGSGLELCDIGMALYVDETKGLRRYLNGQIVDINTNTQAFLNRLLEIKNTNPDYFATEENWQAEALLNIDGCVYKFVLNYSGETVVSVRLPKYPDYVEINAGGTLPVVGNGTTLGLTNGTVNFGLITQSGSYVGNAYYSTTAFNKAVGSNATWDYGDLNANKNIGVTTDATKSGIQTTLKQTKLKMRYFIQIATGSETENNIINEIELNNPYSLFDSKYSDHELNNLSWLKSAGQWNAKAVYTDAYDKLLKVYNGTETVEGLSVKLSTETYTDYDFVLNTADETFRLPLKTLHSDDTVDSFLLYFYIGETVQNANLIDAGRIGEQLANKQDKCIHIIDTYVNGTSGYRIWSDGYCEQWGQTGQLPTTSTITTISLLKAYNNTNYFVQFQDRGTVQNQYSGGVSINNANFTTHSFQILPYTDNSMNIYWKASGYLAGGEY